MHRAGWRGGDAPRAQHAAPGAAGRGRLRVAAPRPRRASLRAGPAAPTWLPAAAGSRATWRPSEPSRPWTRRPSRSGAAGATAARSPGAAAPRRPPSPWRREGRACEPLEPGAESPQAPRYGRLLPARRRPLPVGGARVRYSGRAWREQGACAAGEPGRADSEGRSQVDAGGGAGMWSWNVMLGRVRGGSPDRRQTGGGTRGGETGSPRPNWDAGQRRLAGNAQIWSQPG